MEEELLDHRFDALETSKANTKLLKEGAPHGPCKLAIPTSNIKIFLHLLIQHATKRPDKRSSPNKPINSINYTKQDLLDKEPNFLRNLFPPHQIKNRRFRGSRIQQQTKHRLIGETQLGLGFQTRTSLLPEHPSSKKRREATSIVYLLVKLQRNSKEKDMEFSHLTKRSEIVQFLEEDK